MGTIPETMELSGLFMHVISVKKLREFWEKHPQSEQPLKSWFKETEKAKWETTSDIKKKYKSADFIANNRVIFDICGNKYRLIVVVQYQSKVVFIRFIGTHDEYNKIDARKV